MATVRRFLLKGKMNHWKRKRYKLWHEQNSRCFYCSKETWFPVEGGRKMDIHNMATLDHIIPLVKGGTNQIENLVMACHGCNIKKTDKDQKEFMGEKRK